MKAEVIVRLVEKIEIDRIMKERERNFLSWNGVTCFSLLGVLFAVSLGTLAAVLAFAF